VFAVSSPTRSAAAEGGGVAEAAIYGFLVLMWVIVAGRFFAVRHTEGHFLMWLALTSGLISITIDAVPALASRLTDWAGTPALVFTLSTVLSLAAVTWVITFFLNAAIPAGKTGRSVRQWLPWIIAVPSMTALAFISYSQRLERYSSYTAVGEHHASSAQITMVVLYEVHLLGCLAVMVYLFFVLSRSERDIAVRWALRTLSMTSIGVASRSVYTLATLAHPDPPWSWSTRLAHDLNMPWYALGFSGITVLGFVAAVRRWQTQRQLNALLPLREALLPNLRGEDEEGEDEDPADLSPRQELIACYTQIEGAMRELREYSNPDLPDQVKQYVRAHHVPGRKRREAIAIAAWIALTLKRLKDDPPDRRSDIPLPYKSAGKVNRDIAQLVRVAIAFKHHPLVARFVETARLPTHTPTA
jgi:hypothetical protein